MVDAKDFIINIVETPANDEEPSQKAANNKSTKEKDLDIDWIINHALQVKFDQSLELLGFKLSSFFFKLVDP